MTLAQSTLSTKKESIYIRKKGRSFEWLFLYLQVMNKPLTVIGLWILLSIAPIHAQSTTGTRGLVKAPTARMFEDGTLALGAAFIPPGYHKRTFGSKKGDIVPNAGLNTFVTVNLFPFMEVMFRYSHEINLPVTPITQYFPDRMFTARFKLLNETEKWPAVVLGMQDVVAFFDTNAAGGGSTPNFASTYLVATKNFNYKGFNIDTTLGYGSDIGDIPAKEFRGLFGGFEITTPYLEDTQLLLDYDATYINIGVQKQFFKRLHTMVSYYPNYQKVGWVLAYRYKMY